MEFNSPLKKKQKFTASVLSFEDIQSDLYHLAAIKELVLRVVCNMYKSEFAHRMKYLQNVDVHFQNVPKEIPEISDEFWENTDSHQKRYKELSKKLKSDQLLRQILEKKKSCKISKVVDKI